MTLLPCPKHHAPVMLEIYEVDYDRDNFNKTCWYGKETYTFSKTEDGFEIRENPNG